MGKRSSFERNPRDFYPTPLEAVVPLLHHVHPGMTFYEPCAGNGALVNHLESNKVVCVGRSDIEPQAAHIQQMDVLKLAHLTGDCFITNPPWDRKILHPIIEVLRNKKPTWLLIDADWAHTKQAAPYLLFCASIVSVGRVKWIPDSKMTGKDNCAWYLFRQEAVGSTRFYGRTE